MATSHGLDGFAHAAEALTGRHYGARNPSALLRALASTTLFCLATACAFTVLFMLGGELLIGLLTDLAEVRALAVAFLPWLAALPLVAVWCFLFDGVAVGLTATRGMRDTMILSAGLVYLPLWWATRELGNTGLWLALFAFFAARGLSLGGWLLAGARRGRFGF
jgi:MATE family multidrug resistance protein